ncbi:OLC1v1020400C1 [Oldenlandia corymbosa var. corymbosa]|uniref:Peroxidase n=1 Tax=Oldenlandia corymbosa var. corymbosa TaxID=529605 RepID=A0AAV1EGB1_OLDCO|nr:OLC1v1020400C1 [Oldenlandia corymbosa var. corymbosa]
MAYFAIFLAILLVYPTKIASLEVGFYQKTCPSAEAIVKSVVEKAFANDSGTAPAFIRLHFHDCFVRGCDASILLNSTPGNLAEKDSSANSGVQGLELIDEAKAKIESQCPNTVSCADILAFAARDSVSVSGGLYYTVPAGRRDGNVSRAAEAAANLPSPNFTVAQLKKNFANKGLSLDEMVTLSGAHSIGGSHCSNFMSRLYSFNKTYSQDPSIDPNYAKLLKKMCPKKMSGASIDQVVVSFDPVTPDRLDNVYYKNLEMNKGLLFSDQILWATSSTRKMVKNNANHGNLWAKKFAKAMVHMGSIEVLSGTQGEIRKDCRFVN